MNIILMGSHLLSICLQSGRIFWFSQNSTRTLPFFHSTWKDVLISYQRLTLYHSYTKEYYSTNVHFHFLVHA